jgi:hypothetical protein
MESLLTDGAALERCFQQRMDESRAEMFRSKATHALAHDTTDFDGLYVKWCAAVRQLIIDVGKPEVSGQAEQLVRNAFNETSNRIDRLRKSHDTRDSIAR